MGVSKVKYSGNTLIDLTNDNVSPDRVFEGVTFHGADGESKTGTFTLTQEMSDQDDLIAQIKSALKGKASGGGSSDVEVSLLTRDITKYSNPTLTTLGSYAFSGTKVTSLSLPAVTTIAQYAFYECTTLQNLKLESLTEVPYNGLRQFKGLVKADLHSITKINQNGFYQCTSLETLIIRTPSVCVLSAGTIFNGSLIFSGTGYIYVPSNLVNSYKNATNWTAFANQIRAIEDYPEICG